MNEKLCEAVEASYSFWFMPFLQRPNHATISKLGMAEHIAHILSLLHVIHLFGYTRWAASNAAYILCVQKKGDSLQQFCMVAGVSTGASVRSRKLQQRDAILRRTGFIEGPAYKKGVGGTGPSVDSPLALCLWSLVPVIC